MRSQLRITLLLTMGALLLAPATEAAKHKKKTGTKSLHHCVKDGAEVSGVHKKDCRAQGGKWLKVKPAK